MKLRFWEWLRWTGTTDLCQVGNDVVCVDIDQERIKKLKQGIIEFMNRILSL